MKNSSRPHDPSRASTRKRKNDIEHQIQSAVIEWRDRMIPQQPLLKLLHAVPNGAKLPYRKKIIGDRVVRACRQAIRLKREGLTAGIPDLSWPVPRGRFHGLYIETKSPDGKVSKDQAAIHALLLQQGYQVLVLRDPEVIIREILAYWMAGPFSG